MVDWPTTTIGEIFDIGSGKTMSSKRRSDAEATPFLRTSNVFWDRIDLSKVDEMPMLPWEREEKSLLPGDLLVCEGGEIGRAAVWEGQAEGISFQNHLHRLRRKSDEVDPGFYAYFLQAAFTQLGIYEGAGNKTTIPNLSRNRLAALDVPKPDYHEQCDIRSVLKRTRAAMDLTDESIRVAAELKRAAMHDLFRRGLRGQAQKDSEIGPVPESWDTPRIDDVADLISTRMTYAALLSSVDRNPINDGARVLGIKVADMNPSHAASVINDAQLVGYVPKDVLAFRCAPPGTIVFPKNGAAVATNKKRMLGDWGVFDPNVMGLSAKDQANQRYLFHWMLAFDLAAIVKPGPVPHFNKSDLAPVRLPMPTDAGERDEIVTIFDAIDAKIDVHMRKRALLDELFRALLHKLMTGEIRIADLDLAALEANQEMAA